MNKNRLAVRCLGALLAACILTATGPALAAGEAAKQLTTTLSFMRAEQLYELCTSGRQNEEDHCEGFIVGVAAMMQSEQFSRVKDCIPKGTNSREVMDKVVPYLREKADTTDMRAGTSAVAVIAPALATLYRCTPGKAPQL